ncbi:NifB/NifX family molybdenum-iron cluster-binding protein [Methanogenium sp. S4BF]|uniref:NifB/NifX family molybdenum-iron cluster-binding protein n=1 Tax=Methanogenium sp. S4BF TaxID=1789226 RepID=UPI0024175B2F|nr:NifB/NifX family molybdenum-iron cluster-binding protein [Methanogenium sp. S4BF]WFN35589.1 NifB/NifX family molybdenum-iron cluster-binding protein [Methanogenium sp. S4BF]
MNVCITSKGDSPESAAENRFGRTPFFIVYDDETGDVIETISNASANDASGVGPKVVQMLVSKGVNVVITGQVGGNANKGLEIAGIPTYAFGEAKTVAEAYAAYKAGTLTRIV